MKYGRSSPEIEMLFDNGILSRTHKIIHPFVYFGDIKPSFVGVMDLGERLLEDLKTREHRGYITLRSGPTRANTTEEVKYWDSNLMPRELVNLIYQAMGTLAFYSFLQQHLSSEQLRQNSHSSQVTFDDRLRWAFIADSVDERVLIMVHAGLYNEEERYATLRKINDLGQITTVTLPKEEMNQEGPKGSYNQWRETPFNETPSNARAKVIANVLRKLPYDDAIRAIEILGMPSRATIQIPPSSPVLYNTQIKPPTLTSPPYS